jgi:NAD(P)-dependent dehydrogenase (short-subunit alcohol dehydrogenase family)
VGERAGGGPAGERAGGGPVGERVGGGPVGERAGGGPVGEQVGGGPLGEQVGGGPLGEQAGGGPAGERAALVTGGTTGIGLAIARRLLRDGGRVAITGRNADLGSRAVAELGERALFIAADASDADAVRASVESAVSSLGHLDVLVNNAGVALAERLVDTPVEAFDRLMAVNVRGAFLYAQACFDALAQARGVMIHIGSDAGLRAEQPVGAYSVSKAALMMMSNVFALDGAEHGVRSNCVCPGATLPGMRHIGPAADPDRGDDPSGWPPAPLGRIGDGVDVAGAVAYLAGPDASFVSGAVLLVDGGNGAGLRL